MEENKELNEELNTTNTNEGVENNEENQNCEPEMPAAVAAELVQEEEKNEDEITAVTADLSQEVEEPKKADDVTGTYTGSNQHLDNTYFHSIRYIHDGTISIDDDMEKNRANFNAKLSKSKIIDIISIVMMVIAFAGVIIVTFVNRENTEMAWLTWLILGIALAIIIFSFVLTTIFNKKNSKITQEYLNDYEDMLNGYVISDLNINNPTLCVEAKVDDQDIIQAHYFRTINRIESRAVVEGQRNGYHFSLAEVAVVIPTISIATANKKPEDYINLDGTKYVAEDIPNTLTGTEEIASKDMTMIDLDIASETLNSKEAKKRERDQRKALANKQTETATGLFGKIYSYGFAVDSEEAFILAFMGNPDNTVLPDYLTGFKAVKVPSLRNNIVVYAVNPKMVAKFFDEEGCRLVNDITPNTVVQSSFISMNSYGSKVGMTLSDDIMQLPIKQLAHLGSFDLYKDSTDKAFAFIDYVASKAGK